MLILITLLGLVFGSFINAAVYRLHEQDKRKSKADKSKLSILKGRSICPHCKHQLAPQDLVPLFSWLWLRGKCRYCHRPISVQYPIVELLTAILFGWSFIAWEFNGTVSGVLFALWLGILVGLIMLAVYDLRWMLLPDQIIVVLIGMGLVQILAMLLGGYAAAAVYSKLLAALAGGAFFYALYAAGRGRWMGGGDVKLAFVMGLILGLRDLVVAMVLAFYAAAIISILLIIIRRANRKSLIPFGPFLIAGTMVAQLYGHQLWQLYLQLVTIY